MKALTKYKFIERITRKDGIFLAYNDGNGGGGFYRENGSLKESIDHNGAERPSKGLHS